MDTDTWINQFRIDVLNSEKNYFDELLKYSSLGEISYPNLLLKKIVWGKMVKTHIKMPDGKNLNCKPKSPKLCNWITRYPSLWNELRLLSHYCLKALLTGKECPQIAINSLCEDATKIDDKEFKEFWNEILDALTFKCDCKPMEELKDSTKGKISSTIKTLKTKNKNNKDLSTYNKEKASSNPIKNTSLNQIECYNQENQYLMENSIERKWKIDEIQNVSKLFLKNFNKLNLAYLFLRNYKILNLSELIRKNLQIEYSRPQKFYYNILYNYRINQEKQKLVKEVNRQYKYKRRTRAMSSDDKENTIWTLTNKKTIQDEESITNDKINIKCSLKTAISNNNINAILRLSIDKRIQLLSADELQEVGYFIAMKMIKEKEKENERKEKKMKETKEDKKQEPEKK